MTREIEARLTAIVARIGRIDAAALDHSTDLVAIGMASITLVEVIFAVEEEFDIQIPYATQAGPMTLGALVDQVAALVQARG